eukprot:16342-Heterococcus_DN1.PRE.3
MQYSMDAAGAPISHALLNSARVLPPLALLTLLGWLNAVVLQHDWGRACKLQVCLLELCFSMAVWCGVCLARTDPGYVPAQAQPLEDCEGSFCTVCDSFKPYRRSGRCVARMDHFCIYLPPSGQCIGALNLKQFLQLLVYSWLGCAQEAQLAIRAAVTAAKPRRAMVTAAVVAALLTLWLSVLLCVQLHGIGAAAGAIDRLQGAPGQWRGAAVMLATLQNEVIGIGHWTRLTAPLMPKAAIQLGMQLG